MEAPEEYRARRYRTRFHTYHSAILRLDELRYLGLAPDLDLVALANCLFQTMEQRQTGDAWPFGAVAARRRLRFGLVGAVILASGIIQIVEISRVGRLERAQRSFKWNASLYQPLDIRGRSLAEAAQRFVRHNAFADLLFQVLVHFLGRVVETCCFLIRRPAPGIDDSAAGSRGPASVEAVQHQHRGSLLSCLQRRACARPAEPDDDNVCFSVPMSLILFCSHLFLLNGEPGPGQTVEKAGTARLLSERYSTRHPMYWQGCCGNRVTI